MQSFYLLLFVLSLYIIVGCQNAPKKIHLEKPIYIIVHRENPIEKISTRELRKIYLGKKDHWSDSTRVYKYDYIPAKEAFYEQVLGMSVGDITRHWNQQKYKANLSRPKSFKTERELFASLHKKKGGIGYTTVDKFPDYIKVIAKFGSSQ